MELADNKGDARKVHNLARLLGEQKMNKNIIITCNKSGELINLDKEVLNEWADSVEVMFKGPQLPVLPKVETEHDYCPQEGMILADELEDAVRCTSSNKVSGDDEVIAEYYMQGLCHCHRVSSGSGQLDLDGRSSK